jgi:hypothetical protein
VQLCQADVWQGLLQRLACPCLKLAALALQMRQIATRGAGMQSMAVYG